MNDRMYYSREAQMQADQEKLVATITFLLVGLALGAIVALLFAPDSGKKIRKNISNTIEGKIESGRDTVAPALDRLEKDFADLRNKVEDRIQQMR